MIATIGIVVVAAANASMRSFKICNDQLRVAPASGQAAAALLRSVMKSRRRIANPCPCNPSVSNFFRRRCKRRMSAKRPLADILA